MGNKAAEEGRNLKTINDRLRNKRTVCRKLNTCCDNLFENVNTVAQHFWSSLRRSNGENRDERTLYYLSSVHDFLQKLVQLRTKHFSSKKQDSIYRCFALELKEFREYKKNATKNIIADITRKT